MDVGLAWVGSDMLGRALAWVHVTKALLHPELELVLSSGFLASLANQPFQDCPKNVHSDWVDFGDMWRVLPLVAHTAWRARRTRLKLEVGNEHLQGLARTEFGVFHILHQWRTPACPGKLLITSNFDASFLRGTPDTVTWLSKKTPPGRNWELVNFSSTFWLPF